MARGQNIIARVFNKPQFITVEAFQPLVDYLSNPERTVALKLSKPEDEVLKLRSDFESDNEYSRYKLKSLGINPDTNVGYLHIKDVLVNREGQLNADCVELTSYEKLKKTFKAQVEYGITSCVLMVDSGGGEAYGCFEAANSVKKLAKENNIKLTAYVDGTSASAAFAWTSIADEVIANPMARVGSVGVVIQLYNDSKFLENIGIERTFVYAGGNKIPFDKDGGFSENFINSLQESVDKSYEKFYTFIANNRNMTAQQVIDTQASVYDADKALDVGFIDKIMEVDEFESYMSNGEGSPTVQQLKSEDTQKGEKLMTMENPNVDAQDKTLQEQLTTLTEQLNSAESEKQKLNSQVLALQEKETSLQAQLASALADKAKAELDLETFKKTTEMNARIERLEAVFGSESEKVALYSEAFKDLPQSAFDAFVGEFEASLEKQDKEMEEKGHNAPVDTVSTVDSLKQAAEQRAAKRK